MANKIARIPALDKIIKKRYHSVGRKRIEIGNFWSVLNIYHTMIEVGVSLNSLCTVASMFDGRIDSKYEPDYSNIKPQVIRNYLQLKRSPPHLAHTVVTKTVSKGVSKNLTSKIRDVLDEHNSFGPALLNNIMKTIDDGKGELVEIRASVMGNSGFSQVLKLCIAINELHKRGKLPDFHELKNSKHVDTIIKLIEDNPKILVENGIDII